MSSPEWIAHMTRALIHLDGSGAIRGATGDLIQRRMDLWASIHMTVLYPRERVKEVLPPLSLATAHRIVLKP
jgi:hypothetical protein